MITALTAQNTKGVTGIHDVPPEFIGEQIDAVFSDLVVDAVKIGMLSTTATIEAVTEGLDRHGQTKVVLDPVMVATSGDRLLKPDAVEMLVQLLIPRALVITPNLPEAAALLGRPIAESEHAMRGQAERLILLGAKNVLIKGGHGSGAESIDLLVGRDTVASACRAAHRDAEHARHRLHAVVGDCRRIGEGFAAARGGAGGEGFRHRRDRRREPPHRRFRARAGAPLPSLVERQSNDGIGEAP